MVLDSSALATPFPRIGSQIVSEQVRLTIPMSWQGQSIKGRSDCELFGRNGKCYSSRQPFRVGGNEAVLGRAAGNIETSAILTNVRGKAWNVRHVPDAS